MTAPKIPDITPEPHRWLASRSEVRTPICPRVPYVPFIPYIPPLLDKGDKEDREGICTRAREAVSFRGNPHED